MFEEFVRHAATTQSSFKSENRATNEVEEKYRRSKVGLRPKLVSSHLKAQWHGIAMADPRLLSVPRG